MVKKKASKKKVVVKKSKAKGTRSPVKREKPKARPKAKVVARVQKPIKVEVVRAVPAVDPLPARAPVRRVMRDDRSIVVVADRVEPEQVVSVSMVLDASSAAPLIEALEKVEVVLPKLPKVGWSSLPESYPVQSRFYLSMAEKECRAAVSWPFPFARFIAALPEELCGRSMATLLLALEHPASTIAEILNEDQAFVAARIARDRIELLERASEHCPEMYRKMKTQIGGVGVSIETLVEKYLVSRVDRNFQLVVGALVLQALVD